MSVPPRWLAAASKFVLEAGPLVSALAIAGYLAGGFYLSTTTEKQAQAPVVLPVPDEWTLSGTDLTDLVLSAHESASEPAHAAAEPKAVMAETASVPMPPARPAKLERRRIAQAGPIGKSGSQVAALALPAPGSATAVPPSQITAAVSPAEPEPKRTLLGRTWQTVSGWGDRAAEAVTETPAAVARVGKKTVQTIASAATSILP